MRSAASLTGRSIAGVSGSCATDTDDIGFETVALGDVEDGVGLQERDAGRIAGFFARISLFIFRNEGAGPHDRLALLALADTAASVEGLLEGQPTLGGIVHRRSGAPQDQGVDAGNRSSRSWRSPGTQGRRGRRRLSGFGVRHQAVFEVGDDLVRDAVVNADAVHRTWLPSEPEESVSFLSSCSKTVPFPLLYSDGRSCRC